jgi:methylmalonyl-CoA mutase N-terminal domain/subunit
MRQYAGFTSAVETNERFKYLLRNGNPEWTKYPRELQTTINLINLK